MHDNKLDEHEEAEEEVRQWRWREASGALLLTIGAIVLFVLIAATS
jgi:uncharacterized membrane protein HdeD (DUF308 family)